MRITEVEVQVVEPGMHTVVAERLILNLSNVVVRIRTDEGVEGVAGSTTHLGAHAVASAIAELRRGAGGGPHHPGDVRRGYDQGMLDRIELAANGMVPVPQKPGLGLDIDWERMEAMTTVRL